MSTAVARAIFWEHVRVFVCVYVSLSLCLRVYVSMSACCLSVCLCLFLCVCVDICVCVWQDEKFVDGTNARDILAARTCVCMCVCFMSGSLCV